MSSLRAIVNVFALQSVITRASKGPFADMLPEGNIIYTYRTRWKEENDDIEYVLTYPSATKLQRTQCASR